MSDPKELYAVVNTEPDAFGEYEVNGLHSARAYTDPEIAIALANHLRIWYEKDTIRVYKLTPIEAELASAETHDICPECHKVVLKAEAIEIIGPKDTLRHHYHHQCSPFAALKK